MLVVSVTVPYSSPLASKLRIFNTCVCVCVYFGRGFARERRVKPISEPFSHCANGDLGVPGKRLACTPRALCGLEYDTDNSPAGKGGCVVLCGVYVMRGDVGRKMFQAQRNHHHPRVSIAASAQS